MLRMVVPGAGVNEDAATAATAGTAAGKAGEAEIQ